jgi:hypothetical protein
MRRWKLILFVTALALLYWMWLRPLNVRSDVGCDARDDSCAVGCP